MLPLRTMLESLLAGLEFYLNTGEPPALPLPEGHGASRTERPCKAVPRNTAVGAPPYPYLAYTVTSLAGEERGGYCEDRETGEAYRQARLTLSLTLQSDQREEAQTLALAAHDFFGWAGGTWLADYGMVVQAVGAITNRDNLLSAQFEYREGFDLTITAMNHVHVTREQRAGGIESTEWPGARNNKEEAENGT